VDLCLDYTRKALDLCYLHQGNRPISAPESRHGHAVQLLVCLRAILQGAAVGAGEMPAEPPLARVVRIRSRLGGGPGGVGLGGYRVRRSCGCEHSLDVCLSLSIHPSICHSLSPSLLSPSLPPFVSLPPFISILIHQSIISSRRRPFEFLC
jgi:hypothetical protein